MKRREFIQVVGATGSMVLAGRAAAGEHLYAVPQSHAVPDRAIVSADQVLRGAVVYDGSGAPPVEADVAVRDGRIAAVARSITSPGAEAVDLRGLALAPGFVDIHSHTDLGLLVDGRAESKIRHGVTTEVTGADGSSIGPWRAEQAADVAERYRSSYGVQIDFHDLDGFLRSVDRVGASINLASMIGAGTIRGYVVGQDDRPATDTELARMVELVDGAVRSGACGLSVSSTRRAASRRRPS